MLFNHISRLNGNDANRRAGPGKLMAVTSGDKVDLEVWARYTGTIGTNNALTQAQMVTAVAATFGGVSGGTTEQQSIYNLFNNNAANLFVGSSGSGSLPRAYLNYILFDQDFNYVDAGYDQVSSAAGTAHEKLSFTTINISEGGYLYAYVSNESNANFDVFFDDLRITHTKGAILQEDHYYPFGMNMAALSSSAPLSKPNHFRYNGKEQQTEFDLNWYDYGARNYDAQLGRWIVVDQEGERGPQFSPYNYTFNNPIKFIDPDGNWPWEKKSVRQARAFAKATGGDFQKVRRRDRHLHGGVAAVVNIHGTTTQLNLQEAYGREVHGNATTTDASLSRDERRNLNLIKFDANRDYSHLFERPSQMLANGISIPAPLMRAITAVLPPGTFGKGGMSIDLESLLGTVILQMAEDSSKNEKHGDQGAMGKADTLLEKLQKQLDNASTKKEKRKIKKKMENVRKDAQKKEKGEEHSRVGKR